MEKGCVASMKYLSVIPYRDLLNWSVQYLTSTIIGFTDVYPMVRIGDFLKRNKTPITIEDDKEYIRVKIKINNGGVERREKKNVLGKNIKTKKQYVISEGQFIISKIDARNGAFGVVPAEVDGGIITGNFWTFDVDYNQVNPYYLALLTTTQAFIGFCKKASNGTTNRHYLQESLFLEIQIPIPELKEQEKIVSQYNNRIHEADYIEQKALQIELEIKDYFINMLGVTTKQDKQDHSNKYKYLRFVNFHNISEWGVEIIQQKHKKESFKYPIAKIKQICQLGSGGTPSRSCPQYYKGTIPWVKTGEVVNEIIYETEEHITEEAISNSSARLYPKDSVIIAMYGQGDTRGRTAKLGINATTNQACAVLYDIDNSIVNTDYLWYYLQWRYHDLRSMASGNNQPNLNAGKINNYDVVVPPMDIQNEIVAYIKVQKALVKQLKKKANALRDKAIKEFENKIFK